MSDDIFDFGFTTVNEEELEAVQTNNEKQVKLEEENQNLSTNLSECQNRLDKVYRAVQPLLENLKVNPEKDYIYWPDRKKKVDAFAKHLSNLYQGNE